LVTTPASIEGGDDFQRIRAIDVDIEQKLKTRGITYFEHIAGWSSSDIRRVGQELEIPGRIDREQWIEQAQILAKGGDTYYSRNRKAMLGKAGPQASSEMDADVRRGSASASVPAAGNQSSALPITKPGADRNRSSGVAAASQGRSVAEMAAAAAAAIAAASASVTRGLKPIEPISPLSKVDPKISIPARITDAIREKKAATATVEITKDGLKTEADGNGPSDDLKRIRGVGVLIEKRLNAMSIRRYEQIANWTSGDIDRVSRMLEFKGRIERESWVEQARILASGGQTEFSRRVDKGEVDTSRET
jgi:predicted flap endonuclease-1-like 5' DNA nuclease